MSRRIHLTERAEPVRPSAGLGDRRIRSRTTVLLFLVACAIAGSPADAAQSGFGENGLVTTDVPGFPDASGYEIAIDHAGRIVVAGVVEDDVGPFPNQMAVIRYRRDGSLDPTFGIAGRAVTAFGGTGMHPAAGLAIDDQHRIVVAGGVTNLVPGTNQFAIARFTTAGAADVAFDVDGQLTTSFPASGFNGAKAVAVTAGSGLVAVGEVTFDDAPDEAGVARYDAAGGLDGGFGAGGLLTTAFPSHPAVAEWEDVAVDATGRIVATGYAWEPFTFATARYLADGSLDPGFGNGGRVVTDFGQLAESFAVALDAQGRIVLAGCLRVESRDGLVGGFALARLDDSGALDPTFGNGGLVTTAFANPRAEGPSGCALDVTIDAQERIVAVGFAEPGPAGFHHFAVARYEADGSLDPSFGTGGTVVTTFPNQSHSQARGVAVDSEGRILASGAVRTGDDNLFGVACYNEYGFPCRDLPFEYAAKVVCGTQRELLAGPVAAGFYATTINIHNPSPQPVEFFKKLALTRPPAEQAPGEVLPIAEDRLHYDQALAVDCPDLQERFFPEGGFVEGFVVIQSAGSLDVTAVYSTAALTESGAQAGHSSIDVERIEERLPGADLEVTKTGVVIFELPFGALVWHVVLYTITVANEGTQPVAGVELVDELTLETVGAVGNVVIHEPTIELPPGAQAGAPVYTPPSASISFELGGLPAGDQLTVRFLAITLLYAFADDPSALLRDTAIVSSSGAEAQPADNSVTIETQLLP